MLSAWNIDASQFNGDWSFADKAQFWLRYAALAPSAHNNQPWRCAIGEDYLDIYIDLRYTPRTGTLRQTLISIGAFIENFIQAAAAFGYEFVVTDIPMSVKREDRVARLQLVGSTDEPVAKHRLEAIMSRHTNRGLYKATQLAPSIITALDDLELEQRVIAISLQDSQSKERVAALVDKGVYIALSLPPLRRELSDFVFYQREGSCYGLQVESMVQDPPQAESGKQWTLKLMNAKAEAQFSRKKFASAPVLTVLCTETDSPAIWVSTGQSMQRIFLAAASYGLCHCVSAAPIEIPVLTPVLKSILETKLRPQVLYRIGEPVNSEFTIPSPRRKVDDLL